MQKTNVSFYIENKQLLYIYDTKIVVLCNFFYNKNDKYDYKICENNFMLFSL